MLLACLPCDGIGIQHLARRANAQRNDLALFDMIPGKPMRIDTVETNAGIATLHVKGRAFSRCIHKVRQYGRTIGPMRKFWRNTDPRRHKDGPRWNKPSASRVIWPNFSRETLRRRIVALLTPLRSETCFQGQARIAGNKDVQHTQCAFNRFDTTCCVYRFGIVGHVQTFRRIYKLIIAKLDAIGSRHQTRYLVMNNATEKIDDNRVCGLPFGDFRNVSRACRSFRCSKRSRMERVWGPL